MDVTIIGGPDGAGGVTPGEKAALDRLRGSLRFSLSPLDYSDPAGNLLGHYRTVCISGSLASIGAGGILFSARWGGPLPPIALITRIQIAIEILTAVTVATPFDFEAIGYKGYSIADTGGALVVPTKMRTAMGNSSFADFRMANSTTALVAGTRTLDAFGFGYASCPLKVSPDIGATGATALAAGVGCQIVDMFKTEPGQHPFILAANEGFAVRQSLAGPVTGSYRATIVIDHMELTGY